MHAHVVTTERCGQFAAGRREREIRALVEGTAEPFGTELLGEIPHSGPAAVFPGAQLSAGRADHRLVSLSSTRAQSSVQPVTAILNLRGRLEYSRLPVKNAEIACATGSAATISFSSMPDTGHEHTFRAESPQACTVVNPTSQKRCQMRGTSAMRIQWS